MKKTISIFNLCIINIIFLFFITQQAIAGTYIYHNDKGEQVTYLPKGYNLKPNKSENNSDTSSDSHQDNTKQENIRKGNSLEGNFLESNFLDEKNEKTKKQKK
ncbi:MAG: hypothetical protein H8D87_09080 [Deltaproteobacteria bacterium]|uniref:hypothetical protein n=1 Tax=Desulfobacula sp. TaxID=2593537 RepID=UPI00198C17C4|nr:hypothetical protein [Candidatus Desulfobacula maris]MBL6994287.1 hypothetical protein [Desulfobacula sp.]